MHINLSSSKLINLFLFPDMQQQRSQEYKQTNYLAHGKRPQVDLAFTQKFNQETVNRINP
jgi:hypothetical protein